MPDSPSSMLSPFSETIGRFFNDPQTNWSHFFDPHVVFNILQNAPVEAQVVSNVGSYGDQIGKLIYMVDILREHAGLKDLDEADQKAVDDFEKLRDGATKAVANYRGHLTPDQIVAAVRDLYKQSPDDAKAIRTKLIDALDGK